MRLDGETMRWLKQTSDKIVIGIFAAPATEPYARRRELFVRVICIGKNYDVRRNRTREFKDTKMYLCTHLTALADSAISP